MLASFFLIASLPAVESHAFLTVPASRNRLQCPPVAVGLYANFCLVTQDASSILGACKDLPCAGCAKFPPQVATGGGHHSCTPGNYPGVVPPTEPVCGKPLNLFVKAIGPSFKKGRVQANWRAGSWVTVEVDYLLNHAGNYQFRLCVDGSDTEACFKKTPLKFSDGSWWKWIDAKLVFDQVIPTRMKDQIWIPAGIQCDRCTLNWRWDTALEASIFSNCADVSIDRQKMFTITAGGDSTNKMCLDLSGGRVKNGNSIQLWECNGEESQQWFFHDWAIFYAADPSKCIDITGGESAMRTQGTKLQIWDCNGLTNQNWGYDSKLQTIYAARSSEDASMCMDLAGGSLDEGATIQIWGCNGHGNQQWKLWSVDNADAENDASVTANVTLI